MNLFQLLTKDNIDTVKKYLPVVEMVKEMTSDMKATDFTVDHLQIIADALGVNVEAQGLAPFIELIPRFQDNPDQTVLDFFTGGGLKKMLEYTIAGKPADQVSMCGVCKTHYFRLAQ